MISSPAFSQYAIHEWTNFEQGSMPKLAVTIGQDPGKSCVVKELNSIAKMPPEFRAQRAANETGKFGLHLRHDGDGKSTGTRMNGLLTGNVLDRTDLGETGRAVFLADVFIPKKGFVLPSLAVLAMERPESADGQQMRTIPQTRGAFYRFGMLRGNQTAYFSAIHPDGPAPVISSDKKILHEIARPAWHRFAMVFEGAETIRCYIDGRETSFSPVKDSRIKRMMVGVVIIDNSRFPYEAFVDNLSIQLSMNAPNIPDSPYDEKKPRTDSKSVAKGTNKSGGTIADLAKSLKWLEPREAWALAQSEKKPLLLYFYAPGLEGTRIMDDWFSQDSTAVRFLQERVCSKIDTNQLQGSELLRDYKIFKVPALIEFSPDGKTHRRAMYATEGKWADLEKKLLGN